MNFYKIKAKVHGYNKEEDPKCPWEWRGSHCYDIEVKCHADVECEVYAESEGRAEEMVTDFDYSDGLEIYKVDRVDVMSVNLIASVEDDNEEEISEIDYGKVIYE